MNQTDKEIQVYSAVFKLAKEGKDMNELRVQDIADASNMGKGTLYEYFKSKEEILGKTVEYFFTVEIDAVKKIIAVDGSYESKVRNFMFAFMHRNQKYSSLEVLVAHSEKLSVCCPHNQNKDKMNMMVQTISGILDDLIRVGIDQQVYDKSEDRDYLRFVLLSALSGFVLCVKVSDDPLNDSTVVSAMENAMRMIMKK